MSIYLAAFGTIAAKTRDAAPVVYIAPGGAGNWSGDDWANAAPLHVINSMMAKAKAIGGRVWLRADAGSYTQTSTLTLTNGGVEVCGVDVNGVPMEAEIVGSRASPWTMASGQHGGETFWLNAGASFLSLRFILFRNVGTGIRLRQANNDLLIENVSGINVRRLIDNTASTGTATITNIVIRSIKARGWSKTLIRLRYNSSNILIEDVDADAERQDGDNFCSGIVFDDTAHGIVMNRCVVGNIIDTLHRYQNGDAFAGERGNYDIELNDCTAYRCTDGGVDFKGDDIRINRCVGDRNHRNFRLWGIATLTDCLSIEPQDNAGANPYAQAHFACFRGAMLRLVNCRAEATNSKADVYHAETAGVLSYDAACTVSVPTGTKIKFEEGANGGEVAGQVITAPTDGATPIILSPGTTQAIDENKVGAWAFAADRVCAWRVVGGADAGQFSFNGNVLSMKRQDYDKNPAPRVAVVQAIDGAGRWSAPRMQTTNLNDVDDNPIDQAEIFAAAGAAGGATNGLWITFDGACPMWQDLDGTIPAAMDSPVARVDDISGNGLHIRVMDESAAPILRTDGVLQWLETSGLEQFQIGGTGALRFAQVTAAACSLRDKTDTSTVMLLSVQRSLASGVSFNEAWSLGFTGGASMTNRAAGANYTSGGVGGTVGAKIVSSYRSTTGTVRSNAAPILDNPDVPTLTYPVNGIARFGADGNGGKRFNGRLYGLVVTNRAESDTVLFRIERQLGLLAGLNL